jgi:hypothetical protein
MPDIYASACPSMHIRSILTDKLPTWRAKNRFISRSGSTRRNCPAAISVTIISGSSWSLGDCPDRSDESKDRKSESAHNERIDISWDQMLLFILVSEFSCDCWWWLVEISDHTVRAIMTDQPIFQIGLFRSNQKHAEDLIIS